MISLTLHLREGYCKWLGKCLPACVTLLYFKNWTPLDFHTWRVYTPPKWQERALTNIFSTTLEAIERVRNLLGVASFSLPASNEAWVLHHWLSERLLFNKAS